MRLCDGRGSRGRTRALHLLLTGASLLVAQPGLADESSAGPSAALTAAALPAVVLPAATPPSVGAPETSDALIREGLAFNAAGDALAGSVLPAQAGTSFPDLRTQDQILETSLRWAFSETLAARLYYRYQRATIRNWLQRDLVSLDDHRLFFAHIDESYEVSVYGVTLQLSF